MPSGSFSRTVDKVMSLHVSLGSPTERGGEREKGDVKKRQEDIYARGGELEWKKRGKKVRRNREDEIRESKGGAEEGDIWGLDCAAAEEGRGKVGHGQSCRNFFSSFLSPWKKPQDKSTVQKTHWITIQLAYIDPRDFPG